MAKRRISQRQSALIKKIQEKRLAKAQVPAQEISDTELAAQIDTGAFGPEQTGLLVAHYGKYVDVETEQHKIIRCYLRQNLGSLVAGDNVIWRRGTKNIGVVVALVPRTSLLWRPDDRHINKPVAANINQIIVVIAPEPIPSPLLIDSYLVAAEFFGIKPLILLNKSDLVDDHNKSAIQALLKLYGNLGYTMVLTSTQKLRGHFPLKAFLKDHASIFVGQSGVGKSSLINALIPSANIAINEISEKSKLGRHTTTTSRLYHLKTGGMIIDSPGIREFGLWHLSQQDLASGFIEFRDYLGQCKYRNCLHLNEPECAIISAVEQGKIFLPRYENYQTLIESLEK